MCVCVFSVVVCVCVCVFSVIGCLTLHFAVCVLLFAVVFDSLRCSKEDGGGGYMDGNQMVTCGAAKEKI